MHRSIVALFLSILCAAGGASAQSGPPGCEAAMRYRDGELVRAWGATTDRKQIAREGIQDFQRYRREIESEQLWLTSDRARIAQVVLLNATAINNLIGNLLGFVPGGQVVAGARTLTERVLQALQVGRAVADVVNGEFLAVVSAEVLTRSGPVGQGAQTIVDLARDLQNMVSVAAESARLRASLQEQLAALDRRITAYNAELVRLRAQQEHIDAVRVAIDRYCNAPRR